MYNWLNCNNVRIWCERWPFNEEKVFIYKPCEMTSVLLYTDTYFQLISMQALTRSRSTLVKWENICNLVQIGRIVMFKNLF